MLSAEDIKSISDLLQGEREANKKSVTFFRDGKLLPFAQDILLKISGGRYADINRRNETVTEQLSTVILFGAVDLDIQVNDTFKLDSDTYIVRWISPDKRFETNARVELVQ